MKVSFAAVGLAAALVIPSTAGASTWTSIGPPGGNLTSVAPATGSTLTYAASQAGGIWAQSAPGAPWAFRGITIGQSPGLTVDPRDPRHLFSAGDMGVAESRDGGVTWFRPAGIVYGSIAWGNGEIYASGWDGLLVSRDGGATFTVRNADRTYLALVLGHHPGWMYAIAPDGTWRSRDAGRHWKRAGRFPIPADGLWAAFLATDPSSDDNVLYAAITGALLKSTDEGETWHATGLAAIPGEFPVPVIDPARPQTLLISTSAGLVRSTDGGRSFMPIAGPGTWVGIRYGIGLRFDTDRGGLLYAAGPFNAAMSANDGTSWTFSSTGLADASCTGFAADPTAPGTVWCGLNGLAAVAHTRDGGTTWNMITPSSDPTFLPRNVEVTTGPAHAVLVDDATTAVLRSTDDGATWTPVATPNAAPPRLAVGPAGVVWGLDTDANGAPAVYRSSDDGATFVTVTPPPGSTGAITPDPRDPLSAYLPLPGGVAATHDGGATWQTLTAGLESTTWSWSIYVTADPTRPGHLMFSAESWNDATYEVVPEWYESTDAGAPWTKRADLGTQRNFGSAQFDGNGVLWDGWDGYVVSSAPNAPWVVHDGLPTGSIVQVVADSSNTIYATVSGFGIYRLNP